MDINAPTLVHFECPDERKLYPFLGFTEDTDTAILRPKHPIFDRPIQPPEHRDRLMTETQELIDKLTGAKSSVWDVGIIFEATFDGLDFINRQLQMILLDDPERVRVYFWSASIRRGDPFRGDEGGLVVVRHSLQPRARCVFDVDCGDLVARYDQTPIGDNPISAPCKIRLSSVWSPDYIWQPPSRWLRRDDFCPQEIRDHFNLKEPEDEFFLGTVAIDPPDEPGDVMS